MEGIANFSSPKQQISTVIEVQQGLMILPVDCEPALCWASPLGITLLIPSCNTAIRVIYVLNGLFSVVGV